MIFKPIIRLFILIIILIISIKTDASETFLYLYHTNGLVSALNIDLQPIITFENGYISIANQSFDIKDINKYTFEKPTGINDPHILTNVIFDNKNSILIPNALADSGVSICDMSGISYPIKLVNEEDKVRVDISELSTGIYILKCNNHNYKFRKL